MRFGDLDKQQVVDLGSATTVARLADAGVDVASRRITGFALRKTPGNQDWLPWERLHALGPDAATVDNLDAFADAPTDGLLLRGGGMLGRRVLTDTGVELGTLADVGLDPETGGLTEFVLADGAVLDAATLVGMGSYATVVRAPAAAPAPAS